VCNSKEVLKAQIGIDPSKIERGNSAVGTILGLQRGRAAPDRAGARPYRDVLRRIARKRIPLPERIMDDRNKNLTSKRHQSALCRQVGGLDKVDDALQTLTRRLADTPTRFPWPPHLGGKDWSLRLHVGPRRAFVVAVIQSISI